MGELERIVHELEQHHTSIEFRCTLSSRVFTRDVRSNADEGILRNEVNDFTADEKVIDEDAYAVVGYTPSDVSGLVTSLLESVVEENKVPSRQSSSLKHLRWSGLKWTELAVQLVLEDELVQPNNSQLHRSIKEFTGS